MKRQPKSKLKGTVLFTVISVMSLLIIFLTSTLVLATSASNRSHKNYASMQTEYTARAAIDSFSEAMAKSDGVAQMVVNMKKTDKLTPSVEINDSSMGEIGYYKDDGTWVANQILIEYVDDTYVYNKEKEEWEPQQVIKVTATAELAGEESTVSAYIRKKSSDEVPPLSIKGLQTAGGLTPDTTQGTYTGALALGVTASGSQTYQLNNGTNVKTDLTFINGSLTSDGNLNFYAEKSGSGTVIMGDLSIVNPLNINVNYTPSSDFVQKDIPYMYVDGNINVVSGFKVGSMFYSTPYNIFCGSFTTSSNDFNLFGTDLYIMDSGTTSKVGNVGRTMLTAWNNSLHQGSETQFDSKGGNIYSKGNLELSAIQIDGDVRCEGNVVIKNGVKINGDLVVGGKLLIESNPTVSDIYCDNIKSSAYGSSAYKEVNNIYHPPTDVRREDCIEVTNNEYSFYDFYPTEYMEDGSGRKGLFGENVGWEWHVYYYWNSNHDNSLNYSSMSLDELRGYVDGATGYIPVRWDTPSTYIMQVEVTGIDGDGNLILEEGLQITTDRSYFYDPSSGAHLSESDLWIHTDEYYTKADFDGNDTGINTSSTKVYYSIAEPHVEVDEYTATHSENNYTPPAGTSVHALNDYAHLPVYPDSMTREAIMGQSPSGQEYKIVTTLDEVQSSIKYTGSGFDSSVYLKSVPSGIDVSKIYDSSNTYSNMVIQENCTIRGDIGNNKTIYIKPAGEMWIELDNAVFNHGTKIVVDDSFGSVNFMIKNKLTLYNALVITKTIDSGNLSINESDEIGITFYGAEGSEIAYNNNDTICGTARCPYTKLNITNDGGKLGGVIYNGASVPNPHWIGNALFKEIGNSGDNFTLLYTGAGGSGIGGSINNTLLGESWAIMNYDVY